MRRILFDKLMHHILLYINYLIELWFYFNMSSFEIIWIFVSFFFSRGGCFKLHNFLFFIFVKNKLEEILFCNILS